MCVLCVCVCVCAVCVLQAVAKESDDLVAEVTQYMEDALLWKAELVRPAIETK